MRKTGNYFFLLIFFLTGILVGKGARVTAGIDAEKIGINDNLIFTITFEGIANPRIPDLSGIRDFRVVQTSRSSEFKFVNGKTSSFIHFVYYLMPVRTGNLKIPEIKYKFDGNIYKTPAFDVKVVDGNVKPKKPSRSTDPFSSFDDDFSPFFSSKPRKEREIDIKLRVKLSKRTPYVGEQIILSVFLLTRNRVETVNLISQQSIPGFWQEWYPVKDSIDSTTEMINGKKYNVYEIRKASLFPARSGNLKIPPLKFEMRLAGDIYSFISVPKRVVRNTPQLSVDIKKLPPTAASYPVGKFKLEIVQTKKTIDINDFFSFRIKINGYGNLKTFNLPELKSTNNYKFFPPKIERDISYGKNGVRGVLEAEIPVSFSKPGDFVIEIPGLKFFNPIQKKVESTQMRKIEIKVTGNKSNLSSYTGFKRSEIEKRGSDIKFIMKGDIHNQGNLLFRKKLFGFILLFPFAVTILFYLYSFVFKEYILKNSRIVKRSGLKQTVNRLKSAENPGEIHKIIEQYFLDNTSLKRTDLFIEKIADFLYGLNLARGDVEMIINTFSDSETYKFSADKNSGYLNENKKRELIEIIKKIHRKTK